MRILSRALIVLLFGASLGFGQTWRIILQSTDAGFPPEELGRVLKDGGYILKKFALEREKSSTTPLTAIRTDAETKTQDFGATDTRRWIVEACREKPFADAPDLPVVDSEIKDESAISYSEAVMNSLKFGKGVDLEEEQERALLANVGELWAKDARDGDEKKRRELVNKIAPLEDDLVEFLFDHPEGGEEESQKARLTEINDKLLKLYQELDSMNAKLFFPRPVLVHPYYKKLNGDEKLRDFSYNEGFGRARLLHLQYESGYKMGFGEADDFVAILGFLNESAEDLRAKNQEFFDQDDTPPAEQIDMLKVLENTKKRFSKIMYMSSRPIYPYPSEAVKKIVAEMQSKSDCLNFAIETKVKFEFQFRPKDGGYSVRSFPAKTAEGKPDTTRHLQAIGKTAEAIVWDLTLVQYPPNDVSSALALIDSLKATVADKSEKAVKEIVGFSPKAMVEDFASGSPKLFHPTEEPDQNK